MDPPNDFRSTTLVLRLDMSPLFSTFSTSSLYSFPDLQEVVNALGAGIVTNDTCSSSSIKNAGEGWGKRIRGSNEGTS